MRLFQMGVLLLTLPLLGCKTETPVPVGALRVRITYATFLPKCLTFSVEDANDASRTRSAEVPLSAGARSDTRSAAVFAQAGWSRDLKMTAQAHEGSCEGPVVAKQTVEARLPLEGVSDLNLDLRAEDLDGDGYIAAKQPYPGTDCDDTNADIHPGATELCDGVDNNCVAGEEDAPNAVTYHPDADGDGYGDALAPAVFACTAPMGYVSQAGDCNDANADIHPGPEELRCDGVDENCDGVTDGDAFDVGTACTTSLGCVGARACQGLSSAACVSSVQPAEYYVDDDGDGHAGRSVGPGCVAPVPGATTERADCDESTVLASLDGTEVCDRLDNDCDGQTDNGLTGCAETPWAVETGVGAADARFDAVATYAKGRGWLAGRSGRVVRVEDAGFTPVTDCAGDWRSAWAASNGRVFLGSSAGTFATLRPGDEATPCEQRPSGHGSAINGMVGFEQDDTVTLFAVTSQGRVLRWRHVEGAPTQEAPTTVTQVAANLRAIHGLGEATLLAVGSELVNGQEHPGAWSAPTSGTEWLREDLGLSETGALRGVRVLTSRLAYAVGDKAVLVERSADTWTRMPALTVTGGETPDLRAIAAFGRSAIYAVSSQVDDVHFFNGSTWSSAAPSPTTLNALGGSGPDDVWAAGHDGTLLRWTP